MANQPLRVRLSPRDKRELRALLTGGIQPVRVLLRALALLHLGDGTAAPETARFIKGLTAKTVREIAHKYNVFGLERALYDKERPGPAELLDETAKQRILAMAASEPPAGRSRWTVRLIAEEAARRKVVPSVGRETIRLLLRAVRADTNGSKRS